MLRQLLLLSLIFFAVTFQAQAQSDEPSVKELQNKYLGFLIREGYDPSIDDDGDVQFTYEDDIYFISIMPSDKSFFRIGRLDALELTTESEIDRVIKICHDITKDVKVSKVYWHNDVLWTSTELLIANDDDYEGIFERAMELTSIAFSDFLSAWQDND